MVLKNPKFQFNYCKRDKKSTLWYPNLLNTLNILSHPPPLCLFPTTQFQFIWIYPAILLTKGDNTVHWAQTHSSRSKDPSELVLRGMLNGLRDFLGTRHAHPDLVSVLILHKPRWGSWNISEITGIGISSSWFEGHTLYSRGLDGHSHFYTILVSLKKRVLYEDIWQILKFQS